MVLNLGLKSIRAIIFDSGFNIISSSAKPLTTFIDDTYVEQCPNEWWEKAIDVMRQSLAKINRSQKIMSFTVTASSCCVVPVDINGYPLSRVIMVSDRRAGKQNEYILENEKYKKLVSDNRILKSNPSLLIPKILWIKENLQLVDDETVKYLSPNDYFINRLTGVAVTDTFNAEKCCLDLGNKQYSEELLADLKIDVSQLPAIVDPGTSVGQIVNKDLPEELIDTEVVVSTYDAICAFLGAGPSTVGDACDVSGTVTSLRVLADSVVNEKSSGSVFTQVESNFDIGICGASNNLGGGLIEWCKQAFLRERKTLMA